MSTLTSNPCFRNFIWVRVDSSSFPETTSYKISPTSPFLHWHHPLLLFPGIFQSLHFRLTHRVFSHLKPLTLAALSAIMLLSHVLPSWLVLSFLIFASSTLTNTYYLPNLLIFFVIDPKTIWHIYFIYLFVFCLCMCLFILNLSLPTKNQSQDGKNIVCSVHYWKISD